jgi:hypothetical protein
MRKTPLFISSPLDADLVETIRSVDPKQLDVIYEPDLHPPLRYPCDHKGASTFTRTAEQTYRWQSGLARAEILFDCPIPTEDGPGDIVYAKNAKWLQCTSSGIGELVKKTGLDQTDIIITTARGVHSGPLAEFSKGAPP